jgi:hypothetical protein
MHADLTIDRNVRDWVFFPLTIAIVLMNMLRQYAHQVCLLLPIFSEADKNMIHPEEMRMPALFLQYMNIEAKEAEQNLKDIREQQIVLRSKRLRMLAGVLTPEAFAKRKGYFVEPVRTTTCQCTVLCAIDITEPPSLDMPSQKALAEVLYGFTSPRFLQPFMVEKDISCCRPGMCVCRNQTLAIFTQSNLSM